MTLPARPLLASLAAVLLVALGCAEREAPSPLKPLGPAAAPHAPESLPGARHYAPRQVVVTLELGADPTLINLTFGTTTLGSAPALNAYLLGTPAGASLFELLAAIGAFPGVLAIDLNWLLQSPESEQRELAFGDSTFTPEDYQDQAFLARIDAPGAHAIARGAGVRVAVLDTGADLDHPDLAGHVGPDGFDFIDRDAVPEDAVDGLDQDGDDLIDEAAGHGTHVSGLVLLAAPEAEILPVRVLDTEGWGTSFGVVEGVLYASEHEADVINLSLGMAGDQVQLREAVKRAVQGGAVVVASAGNSGRYAPEHYPAGYAEVVAVAATDAEDRLTAFSNYGEQIDLCAPGMGLLSTYLNGGYAIWSGTSMAAPLVAGGAALVRSTAPQATPTAVARSLAAGSNGIENLNPGYVGLIGAGRVNLHGALVALPAFSE